MASNDRPKRMSAQQAAVFLDSIFSREGNSSLSDSDIEPFIDREESSTDSDEGRSTYAQPPAVGKGKGKVGGACKGKGPAKKARFSRPNVSTATSSSEESDLELDETGDRSRSRDRAPLPSTSTWQEVNTAGTSTHNTFRFTNASKVGVNFDIVPVGSSPLQCFQVFFTDGVMEDLVTTVNDYAKERIRRKQESENLSARSVFKKWVDITLMEVWKFFAVVISMGIVKKPNINDYWNQQESHQATPWYAQMFTRDRFKAIYHSMWHVSNVDAEGKAKIEPFVNRLLELFRTAFYPGKHLSLDEMVIGYKGRWAHKMFNAAKPHKYHVKTFGLCDSETGYVTNLLIYFGAQTSYDPRTANEQQAVRVFDKLMEHIGPGHHIYADRYYTSIPLLKYLSDRHCHYTGTVNINRKYFPGQLKYENLAFQEMKWYMQEDKYLVVSYRGEKATKSCVLVSTDASVETEVVTKKQIVKPKMICDYNQRMNGCDRVDQAVGTYGTFTRRTRKWWKKIFMWIVEICQVNTFILFASTRPEGTKKISFLKFKHLLIQEMSEHAVSLMNEPAQPQADLRGHSRPVNPVNLACSTAHVIMKSEIYRQCKICHTSESRKRTSFYCNGCDNKPFLHPNTCFQLYHSKKQ